ncbi:hydantoinase/oxoprolinase family protein [Halorussus sp. AFM4]|uniref:hydantoinase/oxoprolinase family protein n=1 Tax=Halorussus sp. AFM4 TaxID=3421651 RepID=UPI003EBA522F
MSDHLAVDIGGTFVDAISFDSSTGEISLEKASTTQEDPKEGVLDAVGKVDLNLADSRAFTHGTTLGLNALLEREGATTGIITNEGFRDVFELGRYDVEEGEMYNITYQRPEQLVDRRRRLGVPGRLNADGEVVEPLDETAVREAVRELVEDWDVESIAVCFLHAYKNPEHEQRVADIIKEEYDDVSVSLSSDITNEYREYERTATTVLDAYIKPIFESYVDQLRDSLHDRGLEAPFFITRSGGGALAADNAKTAPVQTILSGPAGGLIGASFVGRRTDREDLITVDMGGTSLDACVIEDGTPAVEYEATLENQPVMIPIYDIRTIGAGGGSIAWLDGGLLKVGPKSAGANPGPICYGKGGEEPTLTDAAVALGYIDADAFLDGEMDLATDAAGQGIADRIADPLGMSVAEASEGIFNVTLANTVGAIREITVEKGLDPREFTMCAYGGAGPMFAPLLARELGMKEILIPQAPSVFSAWGMLMADVVYDFSQTRINVLEESDYDTLISDFERLEDEGRQTLADEGFTDDEQQFERSVEMRYLGQEHTVEVPADDISSLEELGQRFESHHVDRYGHAMDDPAEAVHIRVRAVGTTEKPELQSADSVEDVPVTTTEAYCFATESFTDFDVVPRSSLAPGDTVPGPAIIREPTTTIVFHSDQRATVDDFGHLVIAEADE